MIVLVTWTNCVNGYCQDVLNTTPIRMKRPYLWKSFFFFCVVGECNDSVDGNKTLVDERLQLDGWWFYWIHLFKLYINSP